MRHIYFQEKEKRDTGHRSYKKYIMIFLRAFFFELFASGEVFFIIFEGYGEQFIFEVIYF